MNNEKIFTKKKGVGDPAAPLTSLSPPGEWRNKISVYPILFMRFTSSNIIFFSFFFFFYK